MEELKEVGMRRGGEVGGEVLVGRGWTAVVDVVEGVVVLVASGALAVLKMVGEIAVDQMAASEAAVAEELVDGAARESLAAKSRTVSRDRRNILRVGIDDEAVKNVLSYCCQNLLLVGMPRG